MDVFSEGVDDQLWCVSVQEACLSRLVQGLQVYKVLLAYVKTVYPDNVLPNINSDPLIQLLKNEVRPVFLLILCVVVNLFPIQTLIVLSIRGGHMAGT